MKRLYSKKSGFTLVEIVIAFAVFAIMAVMLVRVLNLTINRRTENQNYEKYLQDQEKLLVTNETKWAADAWDTGYDNGGNNYDNEFNLSFSDTAGNPVADLDVRYQIKSADGTTGDKSGLNYFVGDIDYQEGSEGSEFTPDDPGAGGDDAEMGGSSQMSRFDTRITGTKGIDSIVVNYTYDEGNDEYTVSVTVNDSSVDPIVKPHSQVTLYFGEAESGGTVAQIKEVNGGTKDMGTLKYVKKTGSSGVNIHCTGTGFGGTTTTFTVKLSEQLDSLGFGDNVTGSNTYTSYNGYANIYGAYAKATETPAES